jgi:hypothetical protein
VSLCQRFEKKLLLKAKKSRLEAELLGEQKHTELTIQDKAEALAQREKRRLNSTSCSKPCSHSSSEEKSGVSESTGEGQAAKTDESTPQQIESVCKHEEGEICDCVKNTTDLSVPKSDVEKPVCSSCPSEKSKSNCKGPRKASTCKSKKNQSSNSKNNKKPVKRVGNTKEESSSSNYNSSDSDDTSDDDCEGMSRSGAASRELQKKKMHPRRLHPELWHNDPGLMNDGPVCRCSAKARRYGIRHGFYPGEDATPMCNPYSNNRSNLFHYRITISPAKNFLTKTPTVIKHDNHEYLFEGFSLFSHAKVDLKLPPCRVIRFNILYDIFIVEEKFPDSFCVKELDLFETYLFREILELLDLKYDWNEQGSCPPFHLMPRFVRQLPDNGKEILSMNRVSIR